MHRHGHTVPSDLAVGRGEHVMRMRSRPYRDDNANVSRIVGVAWDVTERRKTELSLAKERNLLKTLMDNLPHAIYFKDLDSRFVAVSRALTHSFGKTDPVEIIGKTDHDFFSTEHAEGALADERKIIRTGKPIVDYEEKETWPDRDDTWVSTTKMPLRDAQGKIIGTFGISRDITAKKRAAEKLARLTEELRAKNESLEQDLEMARELQSSLLPQRFPNFPHHANDEHSAVHFYPIFRPSMIVSGDFFDVFDISDEKAGLFICDVMGHGVRAALVAAIVRSVVTELRPLWTRPGELLIALNRALLATFRNSETMLLLRHVTSWPTLPGASCATPMPDIRIHSASRAQPTDPDQQPRPSTGDEDRALLWAYSRARSTRLSVVSSPRTTLCSCSRTASSKSKARKANSTTISSS